MKILSYILSLSLSFFFVMSAFSEESYDQLWSEVAAHKSKGLPKSSLEVVEKLMNKAEAENNSPELLKSLIHKLIYLQDVEEESFVKIQEALSNTLENNPPPMQALLHSMIAEQYWNYFNQNRWKFYERSATVQFVQMDIRTWDLKKIVETVLEHHEKALEHPEELINTPVSDFRNILVEGQYSRELRPSLFDFVAHRALDFYMNNDAGLTRPAYAFTLNNPLILTDSESFVSLEIDSRDKKSFELKALLLFQSLIRSHLQDKDPGALIDLELKRVNWIYRNAVIPDKEALYEKTLNSLSSKYAAHPQASEIRHLLASLYYEQGLKYQPEQGKNHQWEIKKAKEIAEEAVRMHKGSLGADQCLRLISSIERRNLKIISESFVSAGLPFKFLLHYRNASKVFLRIYSLKKEDLLKLRNINYDKRVEFFSDHPLKSEHTFDLLNEKDYQLHKTELPCNALNQGIYAFVLSDGEGFNPSKNALCTEIFSVSSLAYLNKNNSIDTRGNEFLVTNRETGKPLAGATLQIWHEEYSNFTHDYVYKKGKNFKTDDQGYVTLPYEKGDSYNFQIEFSHASDTLWSMENFYSYERYKNNPKNARCILFTDRSIYRPGQTVFYKGLLYEEDQDNPSLNKILTRVNSSAIFYDVNGQKISEKDFISNDYGTFSGSFSIPSNLLNGQMSIQTPWGSTSFSVEEYKRPKFEVLFKPSTKSFRLKEVVTLTGEAKAYGGYSIDKASVKYRVVRRTFYPCRWLCYWFVPPAPEMEIKNGHAETDAKGEFSVSFEALPDLSLDPELKPAFHYTVYADVTDLNGETRSGEKTVSLGSTAMTLEIMGAESLDKEGTPPVMTITTHTLSGEALAVEKLDAKIYRLTPPDSVLKERLWEPPDKPFLSESRFKALFPGEEMGRENNPLNWERGAFLYHEILKTPQNSQWKLKNLNPWASGAYLIEIKARDEYGEEIVAQKYFTLFSRKDLLPPVPQPDWISLLTPVVKPGEKALILIGSSADHISWICEEKRRGGIQKRSFMTLSKTQQVLEFPVTENDRGGFTVDFFIPWRNRIYCHPLRVAVPWDNKELQIQFETFRNKLYPGEEEEWKLKITGSKGEQKTAEMLAALYDASLDAFRPHQWSALFFPDFYNSSAWNIQNFKALSFSELYGFLEDPFGGRNRIYDNLNWFGFYWREYSRNRMFMMKGARGEVDSLQMSEAPLPACAPMEDKCKEETAVCGRMAGMEAEKKDEPNKPSVSNSVKESAPPVKARTNFNETAFFYPHLQTNEKGEILISFKIPESITRWKMLGFAHTRNLEYKFITSELVTQKDLMVLPNPPRFLREGDQILFSSKITNLTDKDLSSCSVTLELLDAATLKPIDSLFNHSVSSKKCKVPNQGSALAEWKLDIPENIDAVTYRITAKSGNFADGEEQTLPVLKNRMLVTESLPLPVRSKESKTFRFEKLLTSSQSKTLQHHKLTLEFTANPAWYAVMALPYMMEFPYECNEQTFTRYYANSIASYIVKNNPAIERVFNLWKNTPGSNALLSNLEKNQELKAVLLEETPWVLNAKNESERKKRVALLFDLNKMSQELEKAFRKFSDEQLPSGGWAWFKGMREDRYMTQHIVTGLAHMDLLKVSQHKKNPRTMDMIKKAFNYLDWELKKDYDALIAQKIKLDQNNLSFIQIHYLYSRSYFKDIPVPGEVKPAFEYYQNQAKTYWLDFNRYLQGMIALSLHRDKDSKISMEILKSLGEHALHSEEMGMYWKDNYGYYWHEAPIETQALMIELFSELEPKETALVDELKTWLLKSKQTEDWGTTKATAEACYALLLKGEDWLKEMNSPTISLGSTKVKPSGDELEKLEAGTGYFKTSWEGASVTPSMGEVKVQNNNKVPAWGGLYWQYFENLEKITGAETPLKLSRQLFIERPSDTGPELVSFEKAKARVGDRLKVRVELRVDRDMQYVHMKDMRASCLEPENVLSGYKWQDGLGYYESTKDTATHFFMDYLPKGTYVFEYPLRITHQGSFSNGITEIRCMYAPEFSSHSEGVKIEVHSENKG